MADCLFCKIIKKTIPSKIRYEDKNWFVFDDVHPIAPTHVLIIPKKHFATLEDVAFDDLSFNAGLINIARKMAHKLNIQKNYKIFMNVGEKVQAIHHLHLHLYGGWGSEKTTSELDRESQELITA